MMKLRKFFLGAKDGTSRRDALTLIELLVVIAILGILAAVLFPALSWAKSHARSTTCKNHLRQMGLALQMYVHENGNKYPYYRGLPDPAYDGAVGAYDSRFWWAKLQPYYPLKWTDPAYHCPGYNGSIEGSKPGSARDTWTHPLGSYAYNAKGVRNAFGDAYALGGNIPGTNPNLGLGGILYASQPKQLWPTAITEGQIKVPSEMFAIGESRWKAGDERGGKAYMICGVRFPNRGVVAFDPARHGKKYNQLFCDGHITPVNPWVLFSAAATASQWNNDHQPHPEFWPAYP